MRGRDLITKHKRYVQSEWEFEVMSEIERKQVAMSGRHCDNSYNVCAYGNTYNVCGYGNTYNVCAYGKMGFRAIFTLKESISRLGAFDTFCGEFYALSFESISKSLAPRKLKLAPF